MAPLNTPRKVHNWFKKVKGKEWDISGWGTHTALTWSKMETLSYGEALAKLACALVFSDVQC